MGTNSAFLMIGSWGIVPVVHVDPAELLLAIAYFDSAHVLLVWCALRAHYRHTDWIGLIQSMWQPDAVPSADRAIREFGKNDGLCRICQAGIERMLTETDTVFVQDRIIVNTRLLPCHVRGQLLGMTFCKPPVLHDFGTAFLACDPHSEIACTFWRFRFGSYKFRA